MLLQRTIFIIIKPDASGESLHEKFLKKISNNNNNKCVLSAIPHHYYMGSVCFPNIHCVVIELQRVYEERQCL